MLGSHKSSFSHLFPQLKASPAWEQATLDQRRFFEEFFKGGNIFLTGSAGVGKSFCVSALQKFMATHKKVVALTSSTGVSAFSIGGQTIHSWLGIGWGEEDIKYLIDKVRKNKKAIDRIKKAHVLVLDEVSMNKGELLNKIDMVLKYYRHNDEPFGNLVILATGDFLQLSPIWKANETREYAFESRAWKEGNFKTVELKQIVRQSDSEFAALLNRLRVGDITDLKLLESRVDAKIPEGIRPVNLFCKNVNVDAMNKAKLDEIKSPSKFFRSRDTGAEHYIEAFNKNCPAPQVLELKVGAQVQLLVNHDVKMGFVNGSVGIVKAFSSEGVTVKFKHGTLVVEENQWEIKEQDIGLDGTMKYRVVATRKQIPLRIAYASSVHRSQGQTLDCAYVDLNDSFGTSIHYVALSRVRDINSLYLADFDPSRVKVDAKCLRFYEDLNKTAVDNW